METIAERIAARLKDLNKNPSAVALEAGLGRSSVRDILVGKVTSPRLDTLERLTGPLECDLEYLTGLRIEKSPLRLKREAEAPWYDPMEVAEPTIVEAGVFRTAEAIDIDAPYVKPETAPIEKRHLQYNDLRLPGHYFSLFEIRDRSLEDLHILPGDILTAAAPREGLVPLKSGTIVIVERKLGSERASELSARYVDIIDGNIVLTSRSPDPRYKSIPIVDQPGMEEFDRETEAILPNYYFTDQGSISVEGVVVRITRALSI